MVFSSITFLFVFLPVTLVFYFLLPVKMRNYFLLLVSLLFYFWGEPSFIFVMLSSIGINYFMALLIDGLKKKHLKRFVLIVAILSNLGILFYYKYFDFFITVLNDSFNLDIPLRHLVLPIGISFFTFQGMSYIIDLYWGNVEVQRNPFKVALFISLFPQLIAGPIVRYRDVNNEINQRSHNVDNVYYGFKRFIYGLAKKVIIANTAAVVADQIFAVPFIQLQQSTALLAVIAYTIQIYFDFSGYSDMAIGLGRVFGFHFLENFDYPYISKSITEFWRRWHISLSTFFRDYLYIPLGGSRRGNVYINLLIVFFATGLWHGASWNFIVWGFWHGFFMLIERIFRNHADARKRHGNIVPRVYTLLIVCVGWVFFRAQDLPYALGFLKILFGIDTGEKIHFGAAFYLDYYIVFILIIGTLLSFGLYPQLCNKFQEKTKNKRLLNLSEDILCIVLLSLSAISVLNAGYNPFIYFRF